MANRTLSHRERKLLQKKIPAQPRAGAAVRGPKVEAVARVEEPRDGLAWLVKKRRLSAGQAADAMRFREGFRQDGCGVTGSPSCVEALGAGGSGGGTGGLEAAVVAQSDARREYLVICGQVLRGEADLLTAMNGVCGQGYTLRQLAGRNHHRAAELEAALKIALNLIAAWRSGLKVAA